jgi:hypothetical protein
MRSQSTEGVWSQKMFLSNFLFFTIFFLCFRLRFYLCSFTLQPVVLGKEYEENEKFHMIRDTLFLGS